MLDARSGRDSRVRVAGIATRRHCAARRSRSTRRSPFGVIRGTLFQQMQERRLTSLELDSTVLALRQRALLILRNVDDAFFVGPRAPSPSWRAQTRCWRRPSWRTRAGSLRRSGAPTSPRARRCSLPAPASSSPTTALPDPVGYFRRSIAHADEVVRRAPGLADGWLVRGRATDLLLSFVEESHTEPAAAPADPRQANRLDPSRPAVWLAQSGIESRMGDLRAALYSIRRAQEADPLHALGAYLDFKRFEAELQLERYDSAMVACTVGAERYPTAPLFKVCATKVAGLRSRDAKDAAHALRLADSLGRRQELELPPTTPMELRLYAAAILWRAGLADSGDRVYERVTSSWKGNVDPGVLIEAAFARMVRGDIDSALALSARAVREDPMLARALVEQPQYAPLRRDPGFGAATQGIPPARRSPGRAGPLAGQSSAATYTMVK